MRIKSRELALIVLSTSALLLMSTALFRFQRKHRFPCGVYLLYLQAPHHGPFLFRIDKGRIQTMKPLADGVWGTSHWLLDFIGRCAFRCLPAKACPSDDEAYTMTGGAIVCALFGALLGFALSAQSHDLSVVAGTVIGSLVGVSTGVGCGAIVQSVDNYIHALLNSLNRS